MRIFVTGSTGYIGQRLTQCLLSQGHEVHALVRSIPKDEVFRHSRLKFFKGDLLDKSSLVESMTGCSQVYHLAAFARPWAKNPRIYFEINVHGTINILETASQIGVEKLIYSSSCAVLGRSNGFPLTEEHVRDIHFFTEYESSKYLAETYVRSYSNKGIDTVIVSPSKVYGPGLWTESNAVSHLIQLYIQGDWHVIPGNGKSLGCFCFIDDVVRGHLLAMATGRSGEKYILGGENLHLVDFFNTIKKLSGKSHFLIHVPIWLMMLFGWKEEVGASVFGRDPLITRKWIIKYNHDLACSSEKAIQELGYSITPLAEGLMQTLHWINNSRVIYST
jgi:nucleoside-diphosphate-sugar epimerase